jgi:hypothetical protein
MNPCDNCKNDNTIKCEGCDCENLFEPDDYYKRLAEAARELLKEVGKSFNLGDNGYTWNKEYNNYIAILAERDKKEGGNAFQNNKT